MKNSLFIFTPCLPHHSHPVHWDQTTIIVCQSLESRPAKGERAFHYYWRYKSLFDWLIDWLIGIVDLQMTTPTNVLGAKRHWSKNVGILLQLEGRLPAGFGDLWAPNIASLCETCGSGTLSNSVAVLELKGPLFVSERFGCKYGTRDFASVGFSPGLGTDSKPIRLIFTNTLVTQVSALAYFSVDRTESTWFIVCYQVTCMGPDTRWFVLIWMHACMHDDRCRKAKRTLPDLRQ